MLGKKDYKYPKVISIVLYTGRKKWNAKSHIQDVQEKLEGYIEKPFAKYEVVDVNNFSEGKLLKEKTFLSKAMLIEKTRKTCNLEENLKKIVEQINKNKETYTKEHRNLLRTIINIVLSEKIEQQTKTELIENLKGEDKEVLAVVEMIREENKKLVAKGERRGRKQGRKQEKRQTAKKMLEEGIALEKVIKITGLTKEEISKK